MWHVDQIPPQSVLSIIAYFSPNELDPKVWIADHAAEIVMKYLTNSDEDENENLNKFLNWCW
jgi:hypothetical protein